MTNKENTGAIFKNSYKKEGDKSPDYKGGINVNGVEKELALWVQEKDGKKYFSVKVSDPYVKPEPSAQTGTEPPPPSDDLPF